MSRRRPFRVLSVDGGGVRGLIPALLLERIERDTGRPIAELFDLIVGTSTGGIIALSLTVPDNGRPLHSATSVVDVYRRDTPKMFLPYPRTWVDRVIGAVARLFGRPVPTGLFHPEYRGDGLARYVEAYMGPGRLRDALTRVACVSFNVPRQEPYVIRSWLTGSTQPDFRFSDVARATGAPPIYMPVAGIPGDGAGQTLWLADGGVAAVDPPLLAYAEAKELLRQAGVAEPDDEIFLVSLGTGNTGPAHGGEPGDGFPNWGLLPWIANGLLTDLVAGPTTLDLDGAAHVLPESQYYRFSPPMVAHDWRCSTDPFDNSAANLENLARAAEWIMESPETGPRFRRLVNALADAGEPAGEAAEAGLPPRLNRAAPRKKIAVLGGGMAALTSVYELTRDPSWRDRYEITVYQMGWRLGGKAASSRNVDRHFRVEEDGIHMFFGYYDNAISLVKDCYDELARLRVPRFEPLAFRSFDDAFRPHSLGVVEEPRPPGQWSHWPLRNPRNLEPAGGHAVMLPLADYLLMGVEMLSDALTGKAMPFENRPFHCTNPIGEDGPPPHGPLVRAALWLGARVVRVLRRVLRAVLGRIPHFVLHAVWAGLSGVFRRLAEKHWRTHQEAIRTEPAARWRWAMVNLLYGNVRGAIEGRLHQRGFDAINDQDYKDWLAKWAVDDGGLTASCAMARVPYTMEFAYERGDITRPNYEAGTALRTFVRLFLTNRGAAFYAMQSGTGEVLFAPLYLVLKQRGVRFEFFARVEKLRVSGGTSPRHVTAIELRTQATPHGEYDPLIAVPVPRGPLAGKILPAWPAAPLYDQLAEGDALRRGAVDLESWWTPWTGTPRTLRVGEDFDQVILGISIGALRRICADLYDGNPRWRRMLDHVKTVRTQGLQLWLKPTLAELGWCEPDPVLACYDYPTTGLAAPLNTWCQRTEVLDVEHWPDRPPEVPRAVAYFCGPLRDDFPEGMDPTEAPAPDLAALRKANAMALLAEGRIGHLWPDVTTPPSDLAGPLDWNALVDTRPTPGRGPERLDAQFWRGSISPSDRFVMSVRGSSRHRLRAGESGYSNLVLTGDWIDNGYNIGCIESAAMAGMLAANAVSGRPRLREIVGLGFGGGYPLD